MAFIDYYKIMGVDRNTPQSEMAAAYKRRCKQFHPDLHPDDPKAKAKFQALQEANAVLSDPEKRKKYDQYGENWEQAAAFEQAHGGYYNGSEAQFQDDMFAGFNFGQYGSQAGGFSSFFENLFGAQAAAHQAGHASRHDANDAEVVVHIDLYTALLGGELLLQTRNSKLKLKVKPETQNGDKVRLRGKGYQMPDGTYGNLIVTFQVDLPRNLTPRQKELLQAMRDAQ